MSNLPDEVYTRWVRAGRDTADVVGRRVVAVIVCIVLAFVLRHLSEIFGSWSFGRELFPNVVFFFSGHVSTSASGGHVGRCGVDGTGTIFLCIGIGCVSTARVACRLRTGCRNIH